MHWKTEQSTNENASNSNGTLDRSPVPFINNSTCNAGELTQSGDTSVAATHGPKHDLKLHSSSSSSTPLPPFSPSSTPWTLHLFVYILFFVSLFPSALMDASIRVGYEKKSGWCSIHLVISWSCKHGLRRHERNLCLSMSAWQASSSAVIIETSSPPTSPHLPYTYTTS